MATPNVVPVVEGAEDEAGQGRSTIKFPYLDQNDAVEIAKAVHDTAGNSCDRDALAGHLKVSSKGGGFNLRLLTAKLFGFITSESGTVSLTPLGIRVIDPQQEKAARAEAFLLVPLYKRVFDDYRGNMLPGNSALEAAMEKLGVAPKQKDKARQVFQRSATQAGYFAFGTNRLVAPQNKSSAPIEDTKPLDEIDRQQQTNNTGSGKPPDPPNLDPVILGLMAKLPRADSEWSKDGRRKWLQALMNVFEVTYSTAADDAGELKVTLEIPRTNGSV